MINASKILKVALFILASFFIEKINAQAFSVGDTSCNYFKVNKTFTVAGMGPGSVNSSDSLRIDIDGDFNYDIKICSNFIYSCCASGYAYSIISATSPNNTEFVYETSQAPSCYFTRVIQNVIFATALNASLNWSLTPATGGINQPGPYIYYNYYRPSIGVIADCGQQANPYYVAFRKILPSADTIKGWILMNSNFPGKVISYAFKHTAPNLIGVAFTNTLTSICATNTLALSASPNGGLFNGIGVTGNIFSSTTPGNYPVYYTNGCTNAATLNITVNPLPNPLFTNTITTICIGDTLVLNGLPAGGVYSGLGVSSNVFHSLVTGTGNKQVYYISTNIFGCSKTATLNLTIAPPITTLSLTSNTGLSCPGNVVTLMGSGAANYTWSTGAISQSININPTTTTSYSLIGAQNITGGCADTTFYTQIVGSPTVTAVANTTLNCYGTNATLSANGSANYLWSNGAVVQTTIVNPSVTTTYSVIGTNPGGCGDTAYVTLSVAPYGTLTATTNQNVICAGDTAVITISGGNGWIIDGGDIYIITSLSVVPVNPTVTTTFTITSPSLINNCPDIGFITQNVSACVGVKEISSAAPSFKIFPNPNNGEFEIKGTKEETIFISNELGQLLDAKNLNSQNNYSVKINDLVNGIYFVGSRFSKQKIVVIR